MPSNASLSTFHARRNVSMSDAASAIERSAVPGRVPPGASVRTEDDAGGQCRDRSGGVGSADLTVRRDGGALIAGQTVERRRCRGARADRRRPPDWCRAATCPSRSRRAARPGPRGRSLPVVSATGTAPAGVLPVRTRVQGDRQRAADPGGRGRRGVQRRAFDVSSGGRASAFAAVAAEHSRQARSRWVQ